MQKIAAEKKKSNIAEYLLFLWQMEDLIRGIDFDFKRLVDEILSGIENPEERAESIRWFQKLSDGLKAAGAQTSGHHPETYEILSELQVLQQTLMTVLDDGPFKAAYSKARPLMEEFRQKTEKVPKTDVETALTAIYGLLTLKLAGKTISPETQAAVDVFSKYIALLAAAYRDMKSGQLPLNN